MAEKTILLVEDNPDDVILTLRALKKNGISNIEVVRDGAEALDHLFATGQYASRKVTDLPTLVLLDLNLPKLGGLDVLQRLRADDRTRRLVVVVLTSSREENDLVKSYHHGANSYIRKPVDFDQFMEAVQKLGMYWLSLNEMSPV